ncbi:MAG: BatD family protein [Porticoccaceae bacterium]|nr:BatD family protein [Porticoccaceae bacterium]
MNVSMVKNLLPLLLLAVSTLSWAALTATVDRSVIDSNETLQLVIRYDGQVMTGQPDFSPLENDFEILSNNRQQQYSWVNGQSESYTDWTMVLMPKRTGLVLIPSLNFKKDVSNAVEIRVRSASAAAAGAGKQPIYTETLVDKESAYIQEQLVLTHRLYTSVQLSDLSLSDLNVPDVILQKIGDNQYQKTINGRNYLIVEIKYALFPQVAGKLVIPPLRFGAYESNGRSQFGGFTNRGTRIFRSTESKIVDVNARPAHIAADQWMPSSEVQLAEQWSTDLNNLTVGEPVTRAIAISAAGLTGAQITPIQIIESDDYKIYPDQPQLQEQAKDSTIVGTRTETLAMVPGRAGEITFPAINVRWWDTVNQRMQTASLAAKTVQVRPGTALAISPATVQPQAMESLAIGASEKPSELSLLTNLSLAFNALLIAALALLLLKRPRSGLAGRTSAEPATPALLSLKQKFKAIEIQADKNNMMGMRDAILVWGRQLFAETPPTTLKDLSLLLADLELQQQFTQLDRQLYKDNASGDQLDIQLLLQRLKQQSSFSRKSTATRGQELQSLYPE